MDNLRIELIERLCRIPDAQLSAIDRFLDSLPSKTAPVVHRSLSQEINDWPHAPVHRISETGTYFVTASTRDKAHLFRDGERLSMLQSALLRTAIQFDVQLEAWAVFSNHYHFVAHTKRKDEGIKPMIARLHNNTATELNRMDGTPGRQVWFNFWETSLTFPNSYLARLNYVHQNAVKHGLVKDARDYPWCSAGWFERTASPAQVKTIYGILIDRLNLEDEYEPVSMA